VPYSRTNKACSTAPIKHILSQFNDEIKDKVVLDGECLYFDKDGNEDFQKGISLTSRDERLSECENICYVIFDVLLKEKFMVNEDSGIKFEDEYRFMLDNFADFSKESPCYSLIPTIWDNIYIARQDKDIEKLSKLSKENNWEGLMYRNGDVSYEYKRTNNLLKIKKMEDAEFNIVGFEIGSGKYSNTLGSIVIELETGEKVGVGSGFTEEARDNIWEHRNKIMNNNLRLKTQFFERTTDKHGNNSLRFPVALCFRLENGEEIPLEGV
jgi:DNA ligase-1